MSTRMRAVVTVIRSDEAATATEYAVMLLVVLASIATILLLGGKVASMFDNAQSVIPTGS